MAPPVAVSPLIKFSRYAALFVGIAYGSRKNARLTVSEAEVRKIEEKQKKEREERERIAKELAGELV
ncbi:ATP synthase subunit e [Branchiostoma belcheri]|nr:ATP synthase subunit e [Branchiostoma belcheri]